MIVHTFEQHTPEWLKVRLGKFTASKAKQLMSGIDTAGFQGIVNQVVYERLTGEAPEEFRSEWMVRGNELEFAAREAYENLTFRNVNQVGFGEMDEWTGFHRTDFLMRMEWWK